jgi:hypothetical protein
VSHENHHGSSSKQNHSAAFDKLCSICISTHIIITIVINNVSLSSSFLHCIIISGQHWPLYKASATETTAGKLSAVHS